MWWLGWGRKRKKQGRNGRREAGRKERIHSSLSTIGVAQMIASHPEAGKGLWSLVISVIFPTTSCHHNFQKSCQEKVGISISQIPLPPRLWILELLTALCPRAFLPTDKQARCLTSPAFEDLQYLQSCLPSARNPSWSWVMISNFP